MKYFLFSLFSVIPFIIFGQVKLGATLGYELTNIGRYDLVETNHAGNASVGIVSEYRFPRSSFSLSGAILYTTKGYTNSNVQATDKQGTALGGNIDLHRIGYVQAPVYFQYGEKTGALTIKGGIGAFAAFHTGDKLKIKGGDTFGNGTAIPIGKKGITPVIYGMTARAGVEWSSFGISVHFNQSINGLYENQSAGSPKWKVSGYGLSLAYFFVK